MEGRFEDASHQLEIMKTHIPKSGIWSQVYPLHLKDSGEKVMIKAYLEVTEDDVLDDIAALRFLGKPGEIYVPALMGSFNDPSTSLPSLVFSGTIMSLRKRCVRKIGHVSSKEDCKWRLFVSLIPLLQQLIDALEWLHRKGFVHMELSMETVMVDQPPEKHGHIQLFNIGCPRPANIPSAGRLQPLGACRYLPLEVLQGGVYTHDGDIYGFGLIMWELWNGQQVYDDASDVTVEEFTNRLLTGEAVLSALSDVHGANAQGLETKWWAIIQKCTQRQPEERLNQNQIKRELEAYVGSILAKPTLKKGYEPVTPQLPQVNYKPGYRNPDISES
ncbi:CBL-interacting protein kinase 17-like [Lingula anatina]|uniref:CBL-interacting protein kinase 17-like n=1 Tax=Lingula anatina TaxID=7574 RepID=A0A1S3IE29_LINAN|nr:CBL-interacting protein kinase 17-like [Lingula anatina]|eukprot:XP_013396487.1 CBL-interacting protein kinase 17-like [Lingula anatina]